MSHEEKGTGIMPLQDRGVFPAPQRGDRQADSAVFPPLPQ